MFHGPPPHIAHMKVKSNMPQFFMPDELKVEILNKSAVTMAQIDLGQNIG
jgi:PAB-dependent poly(A)-specific ribonuclease subunit 3